MPKKQGHFANVDEVLKENLKDPEIAAEYINTYLNTEGEFDIDLLFEAMAKIIDVYGATEFSKDSGIPRRTLYSAFYERGNPTTKMFSRALDCAGLTIQIVPKKPLLD